MIGQNWNILFSIGQGGYLQVNNIKSIVQILSKLVYFHRLFNIPVGRRYNSNINIGCLGGTYRSYHFFLQHSQKLYLKGKGHISDFVKKESASMGGFKKTLIICCCTSKRPLDMTKEF